MDIAEIRKKWYETLAHNSLEVEKRISEGIENHRKGYCRIRFTNKDGSPAANLKLHVNQKSHDFKFGANIFMLDEFEDEGLNREYRKIFAEYFNLATVPFYWKDLEPEEGKPRFSKDSKRIYRRPAPDLCVEYCEENGILPKLHCLVYDNYLPKWVPRDNLAEMERLYEKRIREIAERYSGRMYEFEVINETMSNQWWHDQSMVSFKRDVVEWAFALAKKYLPNDKLIINDGFPILTAAKQDYRGAYFLQLEKCLLNKTPIDKVGIQHHIFVGNTAKTEEEHKASALELMPHADPYMHIKALDYYEALGLPIELTELTVPTLGDTPEDEELQAAALKAIYSAWFANRAVESIIYWNVADGYAYRSEDPNYYCDENNCRGGLFRKDLTPKKSAEMLKNLIQNEWHTELDIVTDSEGYAEFRGFFGDYSLKLGDRELSFGIHKGETPKKDFVL